jgi:4'-phosphopantetheinyl transferase
VWLVDLDRELPPESEFAGARLRVARQALGAILGELTGSESLRFEFGPDGKPTLPGGPHFSLSHSDGWALIAVCQTAPVGVDLEVVPSPQDFQAAAGRFFTADEQNLLAGVAAAEQAEAFCRMWVAKEACAKQDGGGLRMLRSIETSHAQDLSVVVGGTGQQWQVRGWTPIPGYCAALALPHDSERSAFQAELRAL